MTKKAKKKSIKTGYRSADEPRQTTVCVGYAALCGKCIQLPHFESSMALLKDNFFNTSKQ
jgi:hypothetical protein